jgi:hypothetical protein
MGYFLLVPRRQCDDTKRRSPLAGMAQTYEPTAKFPTAPRRQRFPPFAARI